MENSLNTPRMCALRAQHISRVFDLRNMAYERTSMVNSCRHWRRVIMRFKMQTLFFFFVAQDWNFVFTNLTSDIFHLTLSRPQEFFSRQKLKRADIYSCKKIHATFFFYFRSSAKFQLNNYWPIIIKLWSSRSSVSGSNESERLFKFIWFFSSIRSCHTQLISSLTCH